MARILIVAAGFPSILYPSVELARRLAVAGHYVTFAGLAASRKLVEHHGLAFLPLEPSHYEEFLEKDAKGGGLSRLLNLENRRRQAAESMGVAGFSRKVLEVNPDLLVIDGEMHEHVIAASATGVPIAVLNSFVSVWKRPGLPPPHCLVRPGVGWKGTRLGTSLLWSVLRWRKRRRAWSLWLRRVGCDRLSILRRLAHEASFDFRHETDFSQWLAPFTYRRLPVLSLHGLALEFPHRPPDRVRYVGPMVLTSRVDRPMAEESQKALEAIFHRRRAGGGRKLIYAGFGSVFSTDRAFLRRLLGVVQERPSWELLLSLSEQVDPADLGPLPERVHAFPWVPQLRVLEHADVAITHGGINTIDECVLNAVPVLIYCGFETDMAGNTARVVHHEIGLEGDRRRDGTQAIRGRVDRLLREPRFQQNVERFQAQYLAYAEGRVAERAVDELLGTGSENSYRSSSPRAGGAGA